jgi:hypothetical protein
MKPLLVAALASFIATFPGLGLAEEGAAPAATFTWLSDARGISRAWSASRDTPTLKRRGWRVCARHLAASQLDVAPRFCRFDGARAGRASRRLGQ